ncbi:MAG TPA: DUF3999 family protein [Flavobacteriales bacterium]|nr:DUF3999 family protein [Flavobacteriales bacterium]
MKLTVKTLACILLLLGSYAYGQIDQYSFKRELNGITDQWHKLTLPDVIFGKVLHDLSDIRIFGITAGNDTIEVPYLIQLTSEEILSKEINFKIVNTSHNEKGYYFTFEIPTDEPINQIKLDFKQKNFDWILQLEGSQNQQEWFTIIEDYRILSINNELTDFQFTKISFQNSKYHFFRLLIGSKEKPNLTVAKISQNEVTDGTFRIYTIKKAKTNDHKKTKQTEIAVDLALPVSVSHIKIGIKDTFDYYRPITIKYLTDSINTEQGWKYNYRTLTSGTLNSIEENEFRINNVILRNLIVLIHNNDNQPLSIGEIEVKGYVHELVARFTEPASYFLTYGNNNARKPQYDIDRFTNKIPEEITMLDLGDEQKIDKEELSVIEPLFKNKTWLWLIMATIILLLGWFSFNMIRKN